MHVSDFIKIPIQMIFFIRYEIKQELNDINYLLRI